MNRPQISSAVAHLVERSLPIEEFLRRVNQPLTDEELQETVELFRWFTRRYPSIKQRLAYVRRAYAQWNRIIPPVRSP